MFVIQQEGCLPATDMGIALIRASEFHLWYTGEPIPYRMQEDSSHVRANDIPVGSVEWTENVSGRSLKVYNIPEQLRRPPYVLRTVFEANKFILEACLQSGPLFVKSAVKNKAFAADIIRSVVEVPEQEKYFCSEPVTFTEEWRAFVYRDRVLDVKQYAGSWDQPLTKVESQWLNSLVRSRFVPLAAYTIDFGRTKNGVELVEIHNFVACGLYGFEDFESIARMAKSAWKDESAF